MPKIELRDFNLGGLADSALQGAPNSLYRITGVDLHGKPGVIRLSQALKKDSGSTADGLCKHKVECSNGETYFFSAGSGNIFRRSSAGAWSLAYTTIAGAGAHICLGAIEYDGYIIWATQSRLHRISVADATGTWSTAGSLSINWQTFTNTDLEFHPMLEVNLKLYIGDGKTVAEWDGTTFTANKLPINTPHRVSALGKSPDGYELLIGTYIASNVSRCKVYRWNTWSTNFTSDDDIFEVGVNCFLPVDNTSVIQAGIKGMLYQYNGEKWIKFKRIPGDWTEGKSAIVYPQAAINLNGTVLFGVSNVSGNPLIQGVYELGQAGPDFLLVLSVKHLISSTNFNTVKIGCLAAAGDKLLCSWEDASTVGVDIIDTANKTGIGSIHTRTINLDRSNVKQFKITVHFRKRPTGTGVVIYASTNGDSTVSSSLDHTYDDDHLTAYVENVVEALFVEFFIEIVASGNNTPEIDVITIEW